MSSRRLPCWLAASLFAASPAAAHAPPQATGIQWLAGEAGDRALVRTNRGLIVEDLGTKSFRIVCSDAFDVPLSEVPPVVVARDGRLLLGTYASGLLLSTPDLCGYESTAGPFEGLYPIAVSADTEGVVYAAGLPYDGSPARLLRSSDAGDAGVLLTELPGAPTALEIAASDSSRLYVSVTIAQDNLSMGRLLTSSDAGSSFDEHPIELDDSELRVFLLAVAPDDPELSFVRTQSRLGTTPERLLRSRDGGETFETVLSVPGPISVAIGTGGVVWAGAADGLYRSDDQGGSFERLEAVDVTRVSCLATRGAALYACGYSAGEFGVLVSGDGATFEWFLRFPQVTARLDCPPHSDEAERCAYPFEDWAVEQGIATPGSSGAAGAEGSGGPGLPRGHDRDAGCQLPTGVFAERGWVLVGMALAAASLRHVRRLRGLARLSDGR
jgi:hypothetical protein